MVGYLPAGGAGGGAMTVGDGKAGVTAGAVSGKGFPTDHPCLPATSLIILKRSASLMGAGFLRLAAFFETLPFLVGLSFLSRFFFVFCTGGCNPEPGLEDEYGSSGRLAALSVTRDKGASSGSPADQWCGPLLGTVSL